MNPVAALLGRLAREGFRLEALGVHIAVRPKDRLTPELRDEITRHRSDVLELLRIHGPNLMALFADAPTWSPPRGRSGVLADPDAVLRAVGGPVSLPNGREGTLRAVLYETRSGLTRCKVDLAGGETLVLGAEQVLPPATYNESATASGTKARIPEATRPKATLPSAEDTIATFVSSGKKAPLAA